MDRVQKDFEIIIIGADISGINATYRVQTELQITAPQCWRAGTQSVGHGICFATPASDPIQICIPSASHGVQSDKVISSGQSTHDDVVDSAQRFGIALSPSVCEWELEF